jgi:hypothetical protein
MVEHHSCRSCRGYRVRPIRIGYATNQKLASQLHRRRKSSAPSMDQKYSKIIDKNTQVNHRNLKIVKHIK